MILSAIIGRGEGRRVVLFVFNDFPTTTIDMYDPKWMYLLDVRGSRIILLAWVAIAYGVKKVKIEPF